MDQFQKARERQRGREVDRKMGRAAEQQSIVAGQQNLKKRSKCRAAELVEEKRTSHRSPFMESRAVMRV